MRKDLQTLVAWLGTAVGAIALPGCGTSAGGGAPNVDGSVVDAADAAAESSENDANDAAPRADAADSGSDAADGSGASSACNPANCGGACCGDQCVPRTCSSCPGAPVFCPFYTTIQNSNGRCISDCAACVADVPAAITCFVCGGGAPTKRCAASPNQCPVGLSAGACPCAPGDAGLCPGPTQVCLAVEAGAECLNCGQSDGDAGTGSLTCANGKSCQQTSAVCQ